MGRGGQNARPFSPRREVYIVLNRSRGSANRTDRAFDLRAALLLQFLHPMLLVIEHGCGKRQGTMHPDMGE